MKKKKKERFASATGRATIFLPPRMHKCTQSCMSSKVELNWSKKRGDKHLCISLCGWNPASGRLGFSEVCCDLTGPVTGGTVNIRLSCDSHCGLKEAAKGQCFLMPLPTTKLSDFISLLIRLSYFKGRIHWRCCITHVHARRAIVYISFKEHATSTDHTGACTCRRSPGFCYISSSGPRWM